MQWRWAVDAQSLHMVFGAVSLVTLPPIFRVRLSRRDHQTVAVFFGEDGGGADCGLDPVAANNRARGPLPALAPTVGRHIAINQDIVRIAAKGLHQIAHTACHRQHGRLKNVHPVNLVWMHLDNGESAALPDPFVEDGAALGR